MEKRPFIGMSCLTVCPAGGLSQDVIDAQGLAEAARYREEQEATIPNFTDDAVRFDRQFAAGYIVAFLNEQDCFLADPDGYRAEVQQHAVLLLPEARIIESDHPSRPAESPRQPSTLCRVLIATKETQGRRSNDFFWAQEGELVTFPAMVCDGEEEVDDACGCRRSMTGVHSLKSTTTVQVIYLPNGLERLRLDLRSYWERSGWGRLLDAATITDMIEADAAELIRIASSFPVRTILEIRGDVFQVRPPVERERSSR